MKISFIFLFFLLSVKLIANPITMTNDGVTSVMELVSSERAQRLKELYETRYNYAIMMDSIEAFARLSSDDSDSSIQDDDDDIINFREQISNIKEGEYRAASISMTDGSFLFLGLMYFGSDYFFMVLFTNTYDREFLNLRIDRRRYEDIFRSSWNMLF